MKLKAQDVARYFESLTPQQMANNPALRAAGQAAVRLRKKTVAGPGRPPFVQHRDGPGCRCADCRRKTASYPHERYQGRS